MTKVKSRSVQLVKELYDKMKKLDKAEEAVKILDAEIKSLKSQLYSEMENDDLEKLTYKELQFIKTDKVQFSLAENIKGGKWDEYPGFFDWLKNTGNESLIQTKTSVNPQTRNATLRRIYEKDPTAIPEFIKVSFFNTVNTRKA